jgi:hypothetical protein
MTTTLEIISNGTTYDLSDRARYLHKGNAGFGMAPVKRWTEQGASQHGATDRGFLLQPRTLQLVAWILASDEEDYFDRRDELMQIFAPRTSPLQLRLTVGTRVRQIDVHFAGDLSLPTSDRNGHIHKLGISLTAPDPTWYDPTAVAVNFGLSAGTAAMDVPLAIPMNVGSSVIDQTVAVAYEGTWRTSPIITIAGPLTDPVIENETTGEVLDFTGVTVAALDSYTIDTRYAYKTVVNSLGASKIADLTDASDLSTFHIASKADTPGGVNSIRVTGTAATTATQVYLSYTTRYAGI